MQKNKLRALAAYCRTDSCRPVIMERQEGDEIVIAGDASNDLLASADVKRQIGEGEAAVVIPGTLLIEALRKL